MSFDDLINEISKDVNSQVARKSDLEGDEISEVLKEIVKDFREQKQLDIDERKGYYTDKQGNDYLVFNTDKEARKNAEGKTTNKAFEMDNGWRLFAQHTIMFDSDTQFMPKLTVFINNKEQPDYLAWHTGIIARGRMNVKYRNLPRADGDWGINLKDFLKANKVTSIEELSNSTYERVFTFNLYQVLQVKKLK